MSGQDDRTGKSGGLYARRPDIFPRAVKGNFRRLKWAIMAITLTIYYVTPWIRWDRGPYAPDQAVLINLAQRRFFFFQIEIWPHEFYYVAGLLVMAGIGLFLLTATVGRAWCGYACPQTVWTDLFLHIERAIDGDRNAQIKLRNAPLSLTKITRRIAKHSAWLLVGLVTGGAWIFYFADAPTLASTMFSGEGPRIAYLTVGILTATTYVFGGLMREQVCIYMCPWPRIQSAMLDERSLLVTYKKWRGEPRSHGIKKSEGEPVGDCIDCNACVSVCPTGIDIRDGSQLACITCALCIDACDEVMAKVGRPRGLIDYATFEDCRVEEAGGAPVPIRRTLLRSRTLLYFGLWGAVGTAMVLSLGLRPRLDLSVAHDRNPQWVQLSDGTVRNAYTIKVRNMQNRPRDVRLALDGLAGGSMWDSREDQAKAARAILLHIPADSVEERRIYIRATAHGDEVENFSLALSAVDHPEKGDIDKAYFNRPESEEQ